MDKKEAMMIPVFQAFDCGDSVRVIINDCTIPVAMCALCTLVENIAIGAVSETISYDKINIQISQAVASGLVQAEKRLSDGGEKHEVN